MSPVDPLVRAVLFDLDDTLVPQRQWLDGAWDAVATAAERLGADRSALRQALADEAAAGSARGQLIDRAVARVHPGLAVEPLVAAFVAYRRPVLTPYPGAASVLARCRERAGVAVVTDGRPEIQRAKLRAAGLDGHVDVVVCSDDLGRAHRKPDPLPFRTALDQLGAEPGNAAFVGDRPETDMVGARRLGIFAVRVHSGEYARRPDVVPPDARCATLAEVAAVLDPLLSGRASSARAPGAEPVAAGGAGSESGIP